MANEKNVYLELEGSSGTFYHYSKVEQDGYTKHVYENKTSYRKYFERGVFGYLIGFKTREKQMGDKNVTILSIVLDNPVLGKTFFLSVPFLTGKGSISDFSTSAISYLPNLEKGTPYRVFPYAIPKEKGEGNNVGISIALARLSDEAVDEINKIPRLSYERRKANDKGGYDTIAGDIPAVDFVEKLDKVSANTDRRDTYVWNVLKENYIDFAGGSTKVTFNSQEEGIVKGQYSDKPEAGGVDATTTGNGNPVQQNNAQQPAGSPLEAEIPDDELPF